MFETEVECEPGDLQDAICDVDIPETDEVVYVSDTVELEDVTLITKDGKEIPVNDDGTPSTKRLEICQALENFFNVEIRNEDEGGISPATLESALDSLRQAPDDVLESWCNEKVTRELVKAEIQKILDTYGNLQLKDIVS
jgi:hypothetical protein